MLVFLAFVNFNLLANGPRAILLQNKRTTGNNLPLVFPENHSDYVGALLKNEAILDFMHFQLPETKPELEIFRKKIKEEIIEKAGITVDHHLPFDVHETGTVRMDGYTIKNIFFQTLPGIYATANLYVPQGDGPFPAIIISNGHWPGARLCREVQMVAQSLAMNGYVSLCIDAFGSGERGTIPGKEEYHGANLGASILNVGKTLLGIQVSENMRGIDLLCSLPNVDAKRIGATGGSGGGNQTMWLTAIDERVKAAVPVVSAGTFESYVMESNCVCELLPDGLTFSEESDLLALIAPRAILLVNHQLDANPGFSPVQMLRSYNNARPVYEMLGAEKNLEYKLFDLPHDYLQEDRDAMLSWFGTHFKNGKSIHPVHETDFVKIPDEQLRAFPNDQRDSRVLSIPDYCKREGTQLKGQLLSTIVADGDRKKKELQQILRLKDTSDITEIVRYQNRRGWERMALKSASGKLIPLLLSEPINKSLGYTILCDPKGKNNIPEPIIAGLKAKGSGIAIIDLFGTGEATSAKADQFDNGGLVQFHTISRAELWLGKTVMGEWINDLDLVLQFLKGKPGAETIRIDGSREAGLAALFLSVIHGEKIDSLTLRETPSSYVFDEREGIDFFSMAIHVPGILNWGDVSLAAALSGKNIHFIHPVSMSGNDLEEKDIAKTADEYRQIRAVFGRPGETVFTTR